MASANATPALRPMLPDDGALLAAIFRESIFGLTGEDYSEAQQAAWAAAADDPADFGARMAGYLTLIGTIAGSPVGFASLKGNDHVEMLFVHPAAAGHGVATMLLDALLRLGTARGAKTFTVEASDTARGFFEKHGFVPQHRKTVTRGDQWLGNTHMTKPVAAEAPR